MKTQDSDSEIVRLLEEGRVADEAGAPDLAELLTSAVRRRAEETRAIRRFVLGAAATASAAVVVIFLRSLLPGRAGVPDASVLPPAAMELANWQAPTDALLSTPGSDLWTSVPEIANPAPAFEPGIFPETTKGVER